MSKKNQGQKFAIFVINNKFTASWLDLGSFSFFLHPFFIIFYIVGTKVARLYIYIMVFLRMLWLNCRHFDEISHIIVN